MIDTKKNDYAFGDGRYLSTVSLSCPSWLASQLSLLELDRGLIAASLALCVVPLFDRPHFLFWFFHPLTAPPIRPQYTFTSCRSDYDSAPRHALSCPPWTRSGSFWNDGSQPAGLSVIDKSRSVSIQGVIVYLCKAR